MFFAQHCSRATKRNSKHMRPRPNAMWHSTRPHVHLLRLVHRFVAVDITQQGKEKEQTGKYVSTPDNPGHGFRVNWMAGKQNPGQRRNKNTSGDSVRHRDVKRSHQSVT